MTTIKTWQEQYNPTVFKNKGRALRWSLMQAEIDALRDELKDRAYDFEGMVLQRNEAMAAKMVAPSGFALVPIRATSAMEEVFTEEGWEWANVLAAAEAVTEVEYEEALEGLPQGLSDSSGPHTPSATDHAV